MFSQTRLPVGASKFYCNDPVALTEKIDNLLGVFPSTNKNIRAIMAPHGAYGFSGGVASKVYKQLFKKKVETVFLLGDAHLTSFRGVVIDDSLQWQTVFGNIKIDQDKVKLLKQKCPKLKIKSAEHEHDFVLEVQLPFLERVLPEGFKIVPILFGENFDLEYENFIEALLDNLGENDLIVVSSDMSHYPVYDDAYEIDKKTLKLLEEKDLNGLTEYISKMADEKVLCEKSILCGVGGVKLLVDIAKRLNLKGKILDYTTSGDSEMGDKNRVVGYGSLMFYEDE